MASGAKRVCKQRIRERERGKYRIAADEWTDAAQASHYCVMTDNGEWKGGGK